MCLDKCCHRKLLELILRGELGEDYALYEHRGSLYLKIISEELKSLYGEEIPVPNFSGIVLVSVFTFLEESSVDLLKKYISTSNKLLFLGGGPLWVYVNDCDSDTVNYINTLHKVLSNYSETISIEKALELAHYLTLLLKYSSSVREALKGEITEEQYLRYQLSLEKTAHFLNELISLLGDPERAQEAIALVGGNAGEGYSSALNYLVGLLMSKYRLKLASMTGTLGSCRNNLIEATSELLSSLEARALQVYLLVPDYMRVALSRISEKHCLVSI